MLKFGGEFLLGVWILLCSHSSETSPELLPPGSSHNPVDKDGHMMSGNSKSVCKDRLRQCVHICLCVFVCVRYLVRAFRSGPLQGHYGSVQCVSVLCNSF